MHDSPRPRRARFGPFEVDLHNRELRRQGVRLRVQRQPFAVLETLLETPGDLVSRETLRQRLWPDGTFVEFDKGLNTAVMKLREVLGEHPHAPHFIETVAGEGYRFVAAVELVEEALEPPPASSPARRRTGLIGLAAGFALAAGAVVALVLRPDADPAASRMLRFTVREPPGATFSSSGSLMELSPDGSALAFVALTEDGVNRLFLQPLDALTARMIKDTEHAGRPFWSPDGSALAFFAEGRLKRLDLATGSLRTLDTVVPSGVGGTWSDRGELLYSRARAGSSADHLGLQLASAMGGSAAPLAIPAGLDPEAYLWWPRFLPGGRSYLFLALGDPDRSGIHVASLDGGPAERLSPVISSVEYAGGRLFYVDAGVLLAQPFDPVHRRITGAAVPLAEGVLINPRTGRAVFSVTAANGGIVAYRQPARSRLEWFDRAGSSLGTVGPPAVYHELAIAPDGEQVAATVLDLRTGSYDVWILDSAGANRPLTMGPASEISPVWSADGSRIAYASNAEGRWRVLVHSVREGSEPEVVAESAGSIAPTGWTGDVLHVGRFSPGVEMKLHSSDAVGLAADPGMALVDTASPDRRWIARTRDDTSSRAVSRALYVDAVAPRRGRWHVAGRAGEPRWRSDGGELYYLADDRKLMAVPVSREASLELGPPVALFTTVGVEPSGPAGSTYDAAPDGQRFLVKVAAEPSAIVVLANWQSALD